MKHTQGTFSWTDLSTTDTAGAKAFYGGLLGWETLEFPVPGGSPYIMLQLGGKNVAAMFAQSAEQTAQGIPSMWNNYIAVDDVDAVTAQAAELGGNIVMPAFDVMDSGRMSVIQDPSGAHVALWQAGNHDGADILYTPGTLCWNELVSSDLEKAVAFYEKLFGWKGMTAPNNPTYTLLMNGESGVGGAMALTPEMGPMPSSWGVYFAVENLEESLAKAKATGGKVVFGPAHVEGTGDFAGLLDPQGAYFSLIQMVPMG